MYDFGSQVLKAVVAGIIGSAGSQSQAMGMLKKAY